MARASRTVVPGGPPAAPDEIADVDLLDRDFHHPGLDLYQETGDMAALADAAFQDWSWTIYRIRSADEMVRERATSPRLWMGRHVGPLDLMEVQRVYGGGTFEVWGRFEKLLRTKMRFDIAGARKTFEAAPVAPGAPPVTLPAPAPNAPVSDDRVLRKLDELTTRVNELSQRDDRDPGGTSTKDMMEIIAFAHSLNNPQQSSGGSMKEMVEVFKMGAELAGNADPSKHSTLEIILDKLSPVLEKMGTAMVTNRPRPIMRAPAPPPPAGAAVESQAHVVTEPEPQDLDMDQVRMTSAVDALSRAITGGMDAADFAATLEGVLSPEQMHLLKAMPDEQIIGVLLSAAGGRYPVLQGEPAKAYIADVLRELRTAPSDD